jgi:hypothetical protein
MPGKQASELPLPEGLVPLCLQQLSWLLEVHTQKQIDPKASAALVYYPQLATQCQEPATTDLSEPQAACFWLQEASLPTEHGGPALPTVPDSKRVLAPPSKSENDRFPTKGRKALTCHSAGGTRSPVSSRYTEDQCFTLHLPAGELS